ncbi:MAG: hypothetical protein JWM77_149 [Rhodospirillales bacterium]|nr:hypothetical protein [Rhodospirillales bacterium]
MKTFRVHLGVKKSHALAPETVRADTGHDAILRARALIGKRRGADYADALEVLAVLTE